MHSYSRLLLGECPVRDVLTCKSLWYGMSFILFSVILETHASHKRELGDASQTLSPSQSTHQSFSIPIPNNSECSVMKETFTLLSCNELVSAAPARLFHHLCDYSNTNFKLAEKPILTSNQITQSTTILLLLCGRWRGVFSFFFFKQTNQQTENFQPPFLFLHPESSWLGSGKHIGHLWFVLISTNKLCLVPAILCLCTNLFLWTHSWRVACVYYYSKMEFLMTRLRPSPSL